MLCSCIWHMTHCGDHKQLCKVDMSLPPGREVLRDKLCLPCLVSQNRGQSPVTMDNYSRNNLKAVVHLNLQFRGISVLCDREGMTAEQLLSLVMGVWTRKQRPQAKTRRGCHLQRPPYFFQVDPATSQRVPPSGDQVTCGGLVDANQHPNEIIALK